MRTRLNLDIEGGSIAASLDDGNGGAGGHLTFAVASLGHRIANGIDPNRDQRASPPQQSNLGWALPRLDRGGQLLDRLDYERAHAKCPSNDVFHAARHQAEPGDSDPVCTQRAP